MKTRLSVNLNKIALLRNARGKNFPDLDKYARLCLDSGVKGITLHPRPDQRHATYADVIAMSTIVSEYDGAELNIEGNPIDRFMEVVLENKPHQCTLVPDTPNQITSDHGWDLKKDAQKVTRIVRKLKDSGIRVSLFMDADLEQIEIAKNTGTDRIELYTEEYASSYGTKDSEGVFEIYRSAALFANKIGLQVNAGHDLNLINLEKFLTIGNIKEVSIGHAIIVESLDYGMENTIKKYLKILNA
ncbi:pyridoxine 5'-phosphate synthase [candidate division KSB1 bacterium]|nr:pyridoxine 5'-phosphate synthase [candidate division KSB1 bacterium]MBL7094588.1 pyridoxine 5'-phosphate synthase [candidate division KSB1 bacterium]